MNEKFPLFPQEGNNWETMCPKREDSLHCICWYDGEACCACGGNPPLTNEERDDT